MDTTTKLHTDTDTATDPGAGLGPGHGSPSTGSSIASPKWEEVEARIAGRSFCLLASSSPANRPHVAGVLYAAAEGALHISTLRNSRKVRNIAANPHVAVTVPIRRMPIGPPSTAQFTSTAEILRNDDPLVRRLAADGRLKAITGHGELDLDDGCIIRIAPPRVIHTYGLGLSLFRFVREPLRAGGRVERPTP